MAKEKNVEEPEWKDVLIDYYRSQAIKAWVGLAKGLWLCFLEVVALRYVVLITPTNIVRVL